MTAPQWFSDHMLEFNFLPSCTLHPSRFDAYAMPGLAREIQGKPSWHAAWHKHWSRSILRALGVSVIHDVHQRQLMLALLCGTTLTTLARRVGVGLCAPALKSLISGSSVRIYQRFLGDELLNYARRDSVRYTQDMRHLDAVDIPQTLDGFEALGYSTLLSSLSSCTPDLLRRFELKLPMGIGDVTSQLSSEQAWSLCVAILKDMDPAWCSSFPETL